MKKFLFLALLLAGCATRPADSQYPAVPESALTSPQVEQLERANRQ